MNKLEVATENYEFCMKTLELIDTLEAGFLELGKNLMFIRDEERYAPHWESFSDYVREQKKMSEANVSKLITVYSRYIIKLKINPKTIIDLGGWTIAYEMHRLYHDDAELKDAVEDGLTKNTTDLRIANTEKRTGIKQDSCPHRNTYTIQICNDCGMRQKIYDADEVDNI